MPGRRFCFMLDVIGPAPLIHNVRRFIAVCMSETPTPTPIPNGSRNENGTSMSSPPQVIDGGSNRPSQKRFQFFHKITEKSKALSEWIAPLAALAGLFWGLDWLIERKLSSEDTLRRIAEHARPSLIFNANESIVADMGALPFVDPKDIRVTKHGPEGLPSHIHIGFVHACRTPPILTPLLDVVDIATERGKGLDWEFDLAWSQFREGKPVADIRFRLEIVPGARRLTRMRGRQRARPSGWEC
jgi:hypothetical protein